MHDIDRTQLDFQQHGGPFPHRGPSDIISLAAAGRSRNRKRSTSPTNCWPLTMSRNWSSSSGTSSARPSALRRQYCSLADRPGQSAASRRASWRRKPSLWLAALLGGYIGGPLGAQIGTGLANAAGQALGLEMEFGGSGELEFEGARQFIKLAADTAQNAVAAAQAGADPRSAAQSAAVAAAQRLAPGLLSSGGGSPATGGGLPHEAPGQSGHWKRHGRHIVLYGI